MVALKEKPGLRFGFIERCRIAIDPKWLMKRADAQYYATLIDIERQRAAFKAAETNRLNANWQATGESINTYLARELTRMRNRSRYLLRNVPNAISGMNAFCSYCVGTGIHPISTVYDKVKIQDEDGWTYDQKDRDLFNEDLDDVWDDWAMNADIAGTENSPESFSAVQELVLRKWIEDGEAFVHTVPDTSRSGVPLYVEFFEPESLDTNRTEAPNGNPITMGIETDKDRGRPVAYWIKRESTKDSVRYEAKYIFHIFKRYRPGQLRGFPLLHGVTEKFFQLDEYESAELVACKIAACHCMFYERAKGQNPAGDLLPGGDTGAALDSDGNKITHIQPGMIGSIPHGAGSPQFVSPQKPGATFGMFTEHIQRIIGSGWEFGLSYEALSRNTSKASYAGGRLAVQRDYQAFRQVIKFLNDKWNRPFRNLWMDFAVTAGSIQAPGYYALGPLVRHNQKYYRRHEWIPPAWQYGVNPKDDVAASRDALRAGLSSLDIECAFQGRDWRTIMRMKRRIKRKAQTYGLKLTSDGGVSIANGVEDADTSDEDADKTADKTANATAGAATP